MVRLHTTKTTIRVLVVYAPSVQILLVARRYGHPVHTSSHNQTAVVVARRQCTSAQFHAELKQRNHAQRPPDGPVVSLLPAHNTVHRHLQLNGSKNRRKNTAQIK